MKQIARSTPYIEANDNPEDSFLKDLKNDLSRIDNHHTKKEAKMIKRKMINLIVDNL